MNAPSEAVPLPAQYTDITWGIVTLLCAQYGLPIE